MAFMEFLWFFLQVGGGCPFPGSLSEAKAVFLLGCKVHHLLTTSAEIAGFHVFKSLQKAPVGSCSAPRVV